MLAVSGAVGQANQGDLDAVGQPRSRSIASALSTTASRSEPAAPARVVVRLWLPTTAIFVLLAPFGMLLTPLLYLVPRRLRASPLAIVLGVGRLLLSLGGAVVHIDTPEALVSIRLF